MGRGLREHSSLAAAAACAAAQPPLPEHLAAGALGGASAGHPFLRKFTEPRPHGVAVCPDPAWLRLGALPRVLAGQTRCHPRPRGPISRATTTGMRACVHAACHLRVSSACGIRGRATREERGLLRAGAPAAEAPPDASLARAPGRRWECPRALACKLAIAPEGGLGLGVLLGCEASGSALLMSRGSCSGARTRSAGDVVGEGPARPVNPSKRCALQIGTGRVEALE